MDVSEEQQAAAAARGAGGREGRRAGGRTGGGREGGLFFPPGFPFLWPAFSRTKPTKRKTKRNKITPNYKRARPSNFQLLVFSY